MRSRSRHAASVRWSVNARKHDKVQRRKRRNQSQNNKNTREKKCRKPKKTRHTQKTGGEIIGTMTCNRRPVRELLPVWQPTGSKQQRRQIWLYGWATARLTNKHKRENIQHRQKRERRGEEEIFSFFCWSASFPFSPSKESKWRRRRCADACAMARYVGSRLRPSRSLPHAHNHVRCNATEFE